MKKLRILLLPAALILIGAGAAFATNVAKVSQSTVRGYYVDRSTGECVQSPMQCKETGSIICTWSDGSETHNLYKLNGTDCSVQLFRQ